MILTFVESQETLVPVLTYIKAARNTFLSTVSLSTPRWKQSMSYYREIAKQKFLSWS